MRATYRVLAGLIAVLVVVQAAMIAYAIGGLFTWIMEDGGTLDKAVVESWDSEPPTWEGSLGTFLHFAIIGGMLIPALGLLLLIVSFFAKVPRGVMFAGIVAVAILVQYLLGTNAEGTPILSLLHGLNAFIVFSAAVAAAQAAKSARTESEPAPAAT